MFRLMFALGLALAAAGCVVDQPGAPASVIEPRTCAVGFALGPDTPDATIGPRTLDATGITICLDLDGTGRAAAHFIAASEPVIGESSGIVAVLQDRDQSTLEDGWDVTPDASPGRTYANLEWNEPVAAPTQTVLWLRAQKAPVVATFQLLLIAPTAD